MAQEAMGGQEKSGGGSGGAPTGTAGGDLTGNYPNPTIAALAVTDSKVAAANKDGAAGTASMRTLGTAATQACAGNDSRLSDSRPPNGSATGDLTGTYPAPTLAAVVTAGSKGGSAKLLRSIQYNAKGQIIAVVTDVDLGALATGVVKNTTSTGALSIAAAGVDFSLGPWKLFSTVRNVATAQTLSIPVVAGESNGIVRASGRLLVASGSTVTMTVKINGSATNVTMEELDGTASSAGAGSGRVAILQNSPAYAQFELVMHTAKTGNALKRVGRITIVSCNGSTGNLTIWVGMFVFNDSTTTITSIDLDCGAANGLAANTEALVEEGIVS